MKIPHLKKSLFRNKKEAFVSIMIIMLATTFLNIVPEFVRSLSSLANDQLVTAQAPSGNMTTAFYLVNTQEGGSTGPTCTLQPIGPISTTSEQCTLSQAIMQANFGGPNVISIIFASSLPQINLQSTDLPALTRSSAPIIIDGCQSADCSIKEIINGFQGNPHDSYWAFKINTNQKVTIKNIAFIHFLSDEAFPIKSGEDTGSWSLGDVDILDNYFGSTDGQTLNNGNASVHGISLKIDPAFNQPPKILIQNNILYNIQGTGIAIFIQKPDETANNCPNLISIQNTSSANAQISNNKIGIKKDNTGGDSNYESGDEWGDLTKESMGAIFVCGIRTEISNNVIGNSRKNHASTGTFGIFAVSTSANIHHNEIGVLRTGSGSNTNIFGFGIAVWGDYSTISSFADKTQIHDNIIGNIKRSDCTPSTYSYIGEKACSGSAIVMVNGTHSLIYNNQIGSKLSENEGYGIQIEGIVTASGSTLLTGGGSYNKIFNNTISYNKADGIIIPTALKIIPTESGHSNCSDSATGSTLTLQNCFNTFSQNKIFRNGRYNEDPAPQAQSELPFPAGGIGIDLKTGSGSDDPIDNYSEQKEGSTASTSGTSNDSDISPNDSGGDLDKGGNDLINYPSINPYTGTPAPNSTSAEIRGTLEMNKVGKYWVEVLRVRCNAENGDGNVTESNALSGQCDTDQRNLGMGPGSIVTNGQGFEFLCGAFVNKNSSNATGSWSCKPSDFGSTFNGGLITSTVTEVPASPGGVVGVSILPVVGLKYSCQLAEAVISSQQTNCSGAKQGTANYTSLGGIEANIVQALGNTSEFSQDIFIPTPNLSITKKVRGCTGTAKDSCTPNAFSSETTTGNSTTVEYRLDAFNNGNSSLAVSLNDTQPTGITFNQPQCEYFIVDTVPTSRPSSGAQPCPFTAVNLTLPGGSGTIALPPQKHLVAFLLATVNGSGTISNIGKVIEPTLCPSESQIPATNCSSEARVIVQLAPGDVSLTKTVTPSTITSGTNPQDVMYTVRLTKDSNTPVANALWHDSFPTSPVAMTYKECSVSVTPSTATGSFVCPAVFTPSPVTLYSGNIAKEITQVTYTYKGTIPANAVTSGTGATIINTTDVAGFTNANINKNASATLTILPPGSTGSGSVTLKHVFDNADTGAMTSTVASSTATVDKNYFIVVTFANVPSTGISNFKLSNNFAVTATNLTTPLTYSDCQINYFGSTPSGAPVTCTIPTIGGNTEFYPTGITIPQGLTKIIVSYKGHIAASAVAAGNIASIINQARVDAPGITDVVRAQGTATADASLRINGPGVPVGTGNITMSKVADNNVTNNNRSDERIYKPDETVNYTVTILNGGTGIANGASLRDSVSRNLTGLVTDSLPTGSTGGFSENNLTISNLSIPTGNVGVVLKYRGTLKGNSQFNLSEFDMDSSSDPLKDEDFYAPSNADIEENVDITNNKHKDENDSLDAMDSKFVSLGDGGDIIIDLGKKVIVDGSGDDFGILEIDHNIDDKDQETEGYTVYVSQDGDSFKKVGDSTDTDQFDLGRANLTWAQFIKIEDNSSETKADAPGADIDAVCLFNIGVQLPNTAEVQFNDQRVTDGELVTVDVTNVFDENLDDSDCVEPEGPAPMIVFPPGPPNIVKTVPPPEKLPITGPVAGMLTFMAIGIWAMRRK